MTSDSLNEGLPIKKWPEKSFKVNDSFSIKKIVGSTLELSAKEFSRWTSTYLKIWVETPVFAIQHIENRLSFTGVLPPPPPVTKLILLHSVVVLHFTYHIT